MVKSHLLVLQTVDGGRKDPPLQQLLAIALTDKSPECGHGIFAGQRIERARIRSGCSRKEWLAGNGWEGLAGRGGNGLEGLAGKGGNGWEWLAGKGGNGWEWLAGKGGNGWEWLAGNEFGSSATTVRPFWEG